MNTNTINAVKAINVIRDTTVCIVPDSNPQHAHAGLETITNLCHGLAAHSGWWTDKSTGEPVAKDTPRLVVEKLCLIHSEVSEAMEGDRKDLMDDKLPNRKMLEVELADALIRIHDLAGFLGLDLAGAVIEKLAFNQSRADHKLVNRMAEGGKAY